MAQSRSKSTKNPRTGATVRGFFNSAIAAPDLGVAAQKDLGGSFAKGGLLYGEGNTVPVIAMAAAQQSGTAYRCLERRAQLLEGTAFPTPQRNPITGQLLDLTQAGTMGDTPWPGQPGKTANDLWASFCDGGGKLNGMALLIRYKGAAGKYGIGEVHVLPFGSVRKAGGGNFLLNHKFGRKKFSPAETSEHPPFNPDPKQVKKEMDEAIKLAAEQKIPYKQAGQIFYIYTPKAGEEDYPLPPHWAGLETVFADAAYSRFELEEVEGGFSAKGALVMVGEEDNQTEDERGQTQQDRSTDELRQFTNAGAQEQGVRRKSIMVFDVKTKEMAPIWIPMGTTVDLRWLSDKKEAIGQEVCRHIGIPPILAGFAKAGQLGATSEIINATTLTQNSLESLRKLLMRAFWQVMPTLAGIVPGKLNPVAVAEEITATA